MPLQRKALGRGLSELLGTPAPESSGFREIDIDRIVPSPKQPRKSFDNNTLEDLTASIREHGIVQPLVVREAGGGVFELVAGERRWRAAQRAGLARVPAVVREAEADQALALALVENIQRENLNPVDEARAYQRLMSEFGLTQDEVARRVGKNRVSVANALRLLKLPGEVLQWLAEGRLTAGHAKALASLPDPDSMISGAREVIRGQLSVRQAEEMAKRRSVSHGDGTRRVARGAAGVDPNVRAALMELERALGTRVSIRQNRGKGQLEIHFHSQQELERLYVGLLGVRFAARPEKTGISSQS